MIFPTRGQLAAERLVQKFAVVSVLLLVALDQPAPLVLQLVAAIDGLRKWTNASSGM